MMAMKFAPAAFAVLVTASVALSACAQTPVAQMPVADSLIWLDDPHTDFALTPRLIGEGAESLNVRLADFDSEAQAARIDCLAMGGADAEFTRTTWVPFSGPRFLTVAVNDGYYCGGAYPSVNLIRLTLDRRSGGAPDWASLWPAAEMQDASQGGDLLPTTTEARALIDWFRAAVRADAENDAEWLEQCDGWYGADPIQQRLMIWLDAAAGGIVMDWADLPHVAMACGSTQVMPLDVAARLGASPELLDALRQGHAHGAFKDLP